MEKLNRNKYLFISVKPEFAKKLLHKEKSIELRKLKPNVAKGDYIVIYASSPVKCVVGFGKIKQIIVTTPLQMWNDHSDVLGIDKQRFDEYYVNKTKAIGIELESIKSSLPISLSQLRSLFAGFHPPQVYRYVTNEQICKAISAYIKQL